MQYANTLMNFSEFSTKGDNILFYLRQFYFIKEDVIMREYQPYSLNMYSDFGDQFGNLHITFKTCECHVPTKTGTFTLAAESTVPRVMSDK